MTKDQAETAVAGSALVVGGIYAYRKLISDGVPSQPRKAGGKAGDMLGYGELPPVGQFVTAWGFVYLILSLVSQASPNLGGSFAILTATGAVLANGGGLAQDIQARATGKQAATTGAGGMPVLGDDESVEDYDQRTFDWLTRDRPGRKLTRAEAYAYIQRVHALSPEFQRGHTVSPTGKVLPS